MAHIIVDLSEREIEDGAKEAREIWVLDLVMEVSRQRRFVQVSFEGVGTARQGRDRYVKKKKVLSDKLAEIVRALIYKD